MLLTSPSFKVPLSKTDKETLPGQSVSAVEQFLLFCYYLLLLSKKCVFPPLCFDAGVDSLSWRHIRSGGKTNEECMFGESVNRRRGVGERMLLEN